MQSGAGGDDRDQLAAGILPPPREGVRFATDIAPNGREKEIRKSQVRSAHNHHLHKHLTTRAGGSSLGESDAN